MSLGDKVKRSQAEAREKQAQSDFEKIKEATQSTSNITNEETTTNSFETVTEGELPKKNTRNNKKGTATSLTQLAQTSKDDEYWKAGKGRNIYITNEIYEIKLPFLQKLYGQKSNASTIAFLIDSLYKEEQKLLTEEERKNLKSK